MDDNVCVYTALVGDYEPLRDSSARVDTGIKHICFTDDPALRSETWEMRYIDLMFPMDPIRSQRQLKLSPHRFLPEFDRSIYIDASVQLIIDPRQIFERFKDARLALMPHSFREFLLDEFIEVSRLGFDDQGRIFEQLNHYLISNPDILKEKPYWGGFLLRNHRDPQLQNFCDTWFAHVMRYSRRDQLSLNMALHMSGLVPTVVEENNYSSWFHQWAPENRDRNKAIRDPRQSHMPFQAKLREKELFSAEGDAGSQSAPPSNNEARIVVQKEAGKFDMLGCIDFLRVDEEGHKKCFAQDYVIAAEVNVEGEIGERWFSIADDGACRPALVLARPNAEGETSLFVRWRSGGADKLSRVIIEPDDYGYAMLKLSLNP